MPLVKNDYVSLDWDANTFFERKKTGLHFAVQGYTLTTGDQAGQVVGVAFHEGNPFVFASADGSLWSPKALFDALKRIDGEKELPYIDEYDEYRRIVDNSDVVETDYLVSLGFVAADAKDITARVEDISGYYFSVEKPLV